MNKRIDQRGIVTCYFYDPAGRLVRKLANCNDAEDPQEYEERFEYDAAGRRTLAERFNNGTLIARTRFTFDALSRLTAEEQTVKEETPLTVASIYDNRGNRIALGFPTGRMLELAYDELNRLAAIREVATGNALVDFAYCGPRRVERRRYFKDPGGTGGLPAGVVSSCTYTYNGGQDLIGIDCRDAGGALQVGFSHVIDKAGNKLHEVKLHDLSRSHAYAHDGLHRLVSYTEGTPDPNDPNVIPAPTRQQTWNLDKLGNWKTLTETVGGVTTTQDRSHNKVNELRSITTGPTTKNLKYDPAGNLKDDEVFHYRYDEEQRLKAVFTSVVDPVTGNRIAGDPVARYKYDALGRRVLKRVLNPDGTTLSVMRFYYDGDRVVEERTGGANTPSKQYVWGNYVDELLINDTVDAFGNVVLVSRLYALQNSTYSVHALVNDAGLVVERYSYTSYGEVTFLSPGGAPLLDPATGLPRTSSAVGNVYTFTGREIDAETGLLHFRARSYAPKLGRFLQRDPAGFADGMNLYEFGTSRATVATDPTGNWIANHVVQILRDQGYAAAVTPRNEISVPLLVPNSRDWFDLEYVVVKKHHNWLWNWWHDWNDVREGRPLWIWHDADNYAAAGYIIAAAKDVQAKLVHQRRSVQDIRRIREIATQHPLGWGGWVLEKELMIVGAVANPGVAAAGAGIGGTADVLVQGAENLDDWRAGRQLRGYDPKRTAFVATHSAGVAGGTASLPARAQHGVIGIAVVGLGADVYGDYRSGNAVTGTTKIAITGLVLLGARSAQKRAETAETRAMAEHIGMLRASNLARRPPAPVETVLFRGTSQGFEGSPTLQRYHVTPTTPNPAVATVFATEAANHGHGVVHIVPPSRLAGARTTTPNVLAQLEREVAVEMRPTTFASRAELTISAPDARAILARMGIPIPPRIATGQISTLLREIPDMSPAQVAEFIRLAREVAKGG